MRQVFLVVVLALLAWVGIGRAEAQTWDFGSCQTVNGSVCPNPGAAYAAARARADEFKVTAEDNIHGTKFQVCGPYTLNYDAAGTTHPAVGFGVLPADDSCRRITNYWNYWPSSWECPNGTVWDESSLSCRNPNECMDKAPLGNSIIGGAQTSVCVEGCTFEPEGVPSGTMLGDGSVLTFGTGWKPTGGFCSVDDPGAPQPSEEEVCREQPGNGMTVCVKPDGRHCYSTKMNGRYLCWNPAETGEKTDGPTKQVRNAGDTPIPPSLNLPSGDTLEQAESTTTQTTINNNTSTTTTTNYNTQHGTDAGPPQGSNQGEDGDGGDGEGDGEGDGDVQGGGDCSNPPSCSGNPLACWAIQHNWRQACEAADSDLFGGALGEVMDAFANEQAAEAVEWGAELGSDGEGDLDLHREVREIPIEDLDDSGFLPAGKCPQFDTPTVNGKALPINFAPMCGMLENVGYLVLGLAYFLAFRIIGGGGRK